VTVHQSVRTFSARFLEELRRANYVTPKNYLDFINNYKRALASNRKLIDDMAARLSGGLEKLVQVGGEGLGWVEWGRCSGWHRCDVGTCRCMQLFLGA
jgi:hypothetical protein